MLDGASGIDLFAATPKLRAWRAAFSNRPSVRNAVSAGHAQRLAQFVIDKDGVLGDRLRPRPGIRAGPASGGNI